MICDVIIYFQDLIFYAPRIDWSEHIIFVLSVVRQLYLRYNFSTVII